MTNVLAFTATSAAVAVVFATIAGPILAVHIQRRLDLGRVDRQRKERVFEVLMATRNAFMTVEHVRALNMIEVSFYGKGPGLRKSTEDEVLSDWRYYLSFLSEVGRATQPRNQQQSHSSPDLHSDYRREELFVNLLSSIARDLGYKYDKSSFKPAGGYWPAAHADAETRAKNLSIAAIELLEGKRFLPVAVVDFPGDKEQNAADEG